MFVLNHAHVSMYSALVASRFLLKAMAFSLLLRRLSEPLFHFCEKCWEVYAVRACVSVQFRYCC